MSNRTIKVSYRISCVTHANKFHWAIFIVLSKAVNRQKDGSDRETKLGGDGREIKVPYMPEVCAMEGKWLDELHLHAASRYVIYFAGCLLIALQRESSRLQMQS